jgi:hypothetical protein
MTWQGTVYRKYALEVGIWRVDLDREPEEDEITLRINPDCLPLTWAQFHEAIQQLVEVENKLADLRGGGA